MADTKELEERLARLEGMLAAKSSRLGEEEPVIVEGDEKIVGIAELKERIQELEDLLLLIEMENTKIKEKYLGSANTETPVDVLDRVQKLEEKVAVAKNSGTEELEKKIDDLEEYVSKELAEFDKRLGRIEDMLQQTPVKAGEERIVKTEKYMEESDILEEVQKILKG